MYFEFTLADLKEVKSSLRKIERNVSSTKNSMENGISTIEDYGSMYGVTSTETFEKQIETCDSVLDMIEPFEMRVQEIIDAIEDTEAVENENVTFIYDAEVLDMWLANIKEVLSISNPDYKAIFTLSETYTSWENSITTELDNTEGIFAEGILEEAKQRDDEKVFRHNRTIMQGLELKLREAISNDFVEQLDNIDDIREKLEGLFVLDEISDIRDIIVENIKVGNAPNAKALDNVMDIDEVASTNMKNWIKENIPDEYIEVLDNFKKGGKLVVNSSKLYDAKSHQFTNPELNKLYKANLIDVQFENGSYKIFKKYENMSKWSQSNPGKYEAFIKKLYDNGMGGIYIYDPIEGKYKHKVKGEEIYVSNLPDHIGGKVEALGKAGIVIDSIDLVNAFESGDLSEILGVAGSIGGSYFGEVGALYAAASLDPIPGDALVVLAIGFAGGYFGGIGGEKLGEEIGEAFENGDLVWEFDYE